MRRPIKAEASREQFHLMKAYLYSRHHNGGMSDMGYREYITMIEDSMVHTLIFEYREGPDEDAPLVAVSLIDIMRDGVSMVYTFFNPRQPRRSLGTFMILDQIRYAQELSLPHVYLGYWIKGSEKMDYKRRFGPLEVLDGANWRRLEDTD